MKLNALAAAVTFTALVGCGGESDTATLTLGLTDAPVNGVSEVNIHINSIELKKNSDTFSFEVNQTVNLLDLQGSASLNLIDQATLPAGQYQYIRVDVDQAQSSLTLENGGEDVFDIPSAAQSGLKLNSPFVLSANGNANFTLDFDVAKSLSYSKSQGYKMRPTIRIVDNSEVGHIAGTVAPELATCEETLSVYAFEGNEAVFEEITEAGGPVTSSLVSYNEDTQAFEFEIGFLEAGEYRLDLICATDDPTQDDGICSLNNVTVSVSADDITETEFVAAQAEEVAM